MWIQPEKRFRRHQQVYDLAATVDSDYPLVVLFLAYTGLRCVEMATPKVRRVDLLLRRTPLRSLMGTQSAGGQVIDLR